MVSIFLGLRFEPLRDLGKLLFPHYRFLKIQTVSLQFSLSVKEIIEICFFGVF